MLVPKTQSDPKGLWNDNSIRYKIWAMTLEIHSLRGKKVRIEITDERIQKAPQSAAFRIANQHLRNDRSPLSWKPHIGKLDFGWLRHFPKYTP